MPVESNINVEFWNELAQINEKSSFYDVPAFIKGAQTLHDIELQALPDVNGKMLLHLQCHFGLDSLSWARLGAKVTGVDFSDKAIEVARRLNHELNLDAQFVQSDIYDLPNNLGGKFDIVFTSYGVLCWLKDLFGWAKIVRHFLKDGGMFLIVEQHPLCFVMDDKCTTDNMKIGYSYFDKSMLTLNEDFSYADDSTRLKQNVHYEWTHSLQDIFSSLLEAGLTITSFKEYPMCMYQKFEWLECGADNWWRAPAGSIEVPLTFSISATC